MTPTNRPSRLDLVKRGGIQALPHQGEQRNVSLDRLFENPDNERKVYRNIEGLVETIKGVGILEPLTVEPSAGGRYLVVIGNRRLRAAKQAGLETVPVIIQEPDKAALRRRKSIISNVQREDVGPIEMAEGLQALIDEDSEIHSQRDLAKLIGKREAWVSDMLRILTLPSQLQKKLRYTEVSISYESVMRIARLDTQADQNRLIDALLGGATQGQIREEIDRIKGKTSPTSTSTKPKEVFSTDHGFTVILQSDSSHEISRGQRIAGLKQVLKRLK